VIRISKQIIKGNNSIEATVMGCLEGIKIISEAIHSGFLKMDEKELMWIDMLELDVNSIPLDEGKFVEMMLPELGDAIILSEYGL
jgi:methanol--5-hydroxybenzimidazolylcobamide Co-methyltransferase